MRTPPPDTGAQWGIITPYTRQGQEPRIAGPLERWKAYGEPRRTDHNELTERENSEAERPASEVWNGDRPQLFADSADSASGRRSTTSSTRPKSRLSSADI